MFFFYFLMFFLFFMFLIFNVFNAFVLYLFNVAFLFLLKNKHTKLQIWCIFHWQIAFNPVFDL